MSNMFYFDDGNKKRSVKIRKHDDSTFFAKVDDGEEVELEAKILGQGQFQFKIGNITYKCSIAKENGKRFIHLEGHEYALSVINEEDDTVDNESEQEGDLSSPMPGQIVKILVKVNDEVRKGDDLLVIEAMKMETKITSPTDGTINKIFFKEGDQVEAQVPLLELIPLEDDITSEK